MEDKSIARMCLTCEKAHKRIEQRLRESNDRLELAQYVANLGSWEFNTKKDEAIWSKQLYNIFELSPEAKAPNIAEYSKLIHPDDLSMVAEKAQTFQAQAKLGDAISFDYRTLTPKGLTKILHTERRVIEVDVNNKPLRIMGIEQDITDRKKRGKVFC